MGPSGGRVPVGKMLIKGLIAAEMAAITPYATAARDAKKISIGIGLRSRQVTAIGRLPSWLT